MAVDVFELNSKAKIIEIFFFQSRLVNSKPYKGKLQRFKYRRKVTDMLLPTYLPLHFHFYSLSCNLLGKKKNPTGQRYVLFL